MKVEHSLSEVQRAYVHRMMGELQQANTKYYAALGQAADIKRQADAAAATMGQVLKLIEEEARLPQPVKPYELSPDGTKIVGETADDAPSVPPAAAVQAHQKKEGRVNGSPA